MSTKFLVGTSAKALRAMFGVALLLGGLNAVSGGSAQAADGMIIKQSRHSVQTTIDRLEAILKDKGLTIFAKIDHGAGAAKTAQSLRPTMVLIFGNPRLGTPLMQSQQTIAIDLPQKALAYEAENGDVFLAYNEPKYLSSRHGIEDRAEVFKKITGALDAFTSAAVK